MKHVFAVLLLGVVSLLSTSLADAGIIRGAVSLHRHVIKPVAKKVYHGTKTGTKGIVHVTKTVVY